MMARADILSKIVAHKEREVAAAQKVEAEGALIERAKQRSAPKGFIDALRAGIDANGVAVIAELKKASPSAGVLREDYHPDQIAADYARGGANCLSVLTDESFFQGAHRHLGEASAASALPALRKDFIVSSYQVHESAAMGADAVLLIAAVFDEAQTLRELAALIESYDMHVLLEIHSEAEWREHQSLARNKRVIVGINNRDLSTFEIDLQRSCDLMQQVAELSENPVVCESGVDSAEKLLWLRDRGARCFLIGSALMKSQSPGAELSAWLAQAQ